MVLNNHSLGNWYLDNFDIQDSRKVYKIVRHDTLSNTLDRLKRNLFCTFHLTYAIYSHYTEHIMARSNYKSHALVDDMRNIVVGKHMLLPMDA